MSVNDSQFASTSNENDTEQRMAGFHRIIKSKVCPQIRDHEIDTQSNETRPGTNMELCLSKKGTSTLDLHGARDHANDPNNARDSRKKK